MMAEQEWGPSGTTPPSRPPLPLVATLPQPSRLVCKRARVERQREGRKKTSSVRALVNEMWRCLQSKGDPGINHATAGATLTETGPQRFLEASARIGNFATLTPPPLGSATCRVRQYQICHVKSASRKPSPNTKNLGSKTLHMLLLPLDSCVKGARASRFDSIARFCCRQHTSK